MRHPAWVEAFALLGGRPTEDPRPSLASWIILGALLRGILLIGFYLPVSAAFLPPDVALGATIILGILLCAGQLDSAAGRVIKILGPNSTDPVASLTNQVALIAALVILRFVLLRGFLGFETAKAILAGSLSIGFETAMFLLNTRWKAAPKRLVNLALALIWIALLSTIYRSFPIVDYGFGNTISWLLPGILIFATIRLCAAPGWLAWRMAESPADRNTLLLAPGALGEIGCYTAFLLLRYNFA